MSEGFMDKICQDLFDQFINILMENKDKNELKKKLIDPLVNYFKRQLLLFYSIITILLIAVILTNIYIIYKIH